MPVAACICVAICDNFLTYIVCISYEEAARYLETYKAYENKPPDMIMERIDSDSTSRVRKQFL